MSRCYIITLTTEKFKFKFSGFVSLRILYISYCAVHGSSFSVGACVKFKCKYKDGFNLNTIKSYVVALDHKIIKVKNGKKSRP